METLALYLLKSVIWLTGFALVYVLVLRNERFFELNRLYLISGIVAALILPFVTVTYKVFLPLPGDVESGIDVGNVVEVSNGKVAGPFFRMMLFCLYLTGLLIVAFIFIRQWRSLIKNIRKLKGTPSDQVRLVKTREYHSAFSFFSWIFVNPSSNETEIREIMNHEMVHIRQMHWIDLRLAELLCVLQWFNPLIWIYIRLIKQNHEYIADKVALQRTSDPAIYRAALLNQIVGSPVFSLVNSFSYSLNKKRFAMMENIFTSPYRKMKLLLILPVFAIVFYAFARPDYRYVTPAGGVSNHDAASQSSGKKIKGTILASDGNPLEGANIVVTGTTVGTVSDARGNFSLENIPADAELVISYIGYKSKVLKSGALTGVPVRMVRDTITFLNSNTGTILPAPAAPPPPPPPPSPAGGTGKEAASPLPEMPVTPVMPRSSDSSAHMFVLVEDMPSFPGGGMGLTSWINENLKYPDEAYRKKITGKVYVDFTVSSKGKVRDVKIEKPVNPLLDAEAKRLISSMPDWTPGSQNGVKVDVQMRMPVEFKLH